MGGHAIRNSIPSLFKPAAVGDWIDGWRVCWVGGRDKCRVLFVVMVERPRHAPSKMSGQRVRSADLFSTCLPLELAGYFTISLSESNQTIGFLCGNGPAVGSEILIFGRAQTHL